MKPRVVTIFTKPECGLCEEAEEVVEAVRARHRFELVRRNILDNYTDYEKYKHDIPVILVDGVEIARHHLNADVLVDALHRPPSPLVGEGGGEGDTRGVDRRVTQDPHPGSRNALVDSTRFTSHPNPLPQGERGPEATVVVMAKHPTPGQVKTRLVPPLTYEQAARLHGAFLLHLAARIGNAVICYDPPASEPAMRRLLPNARLIAQSPGDLGQRLAAAANRVRPVVFLGVDSPDVPIEYLDRVAQLVLSHDLVIAPADDGGFWAVALTSRVDAPKLFDNIEWSTGREFAQVLERARGLGYNVAVADRWADVDRPADLRALLERLRSSDAPDDRELLARLSFLPPAHGVV